MTQLASRMRVIANFFAAQGVIMASNLFYGLLCVRLLPADEYAKFVVVFAVQGTVIVLMDVNFTGTLVPLVGERVSNYKVIADYVASLRQLSNWVYGVVGAGLVFFFPFLVKNRNWDSPTVATMVLILLVSTWFMRISSAYGAVLILLRDRSTWYRGQMISSLGTLTLLLVVWSLHVLGPLLAILINVSGIVFVGMFYFFHAKQSLGNTGEASPGKRNAIIALASPNIPQAIFYALQGQLSIFLITFLGRTPGVASVGALGRLGQLFALFMQMNPLIIEPYFAKLRNSEVKRNYVVALALAALICVGITAVTWQVPQLFLWALGPQYRNLTKEVNIAIGASAISCFSGVLWTIHSARRFIYWWNVLFSMVVIVAAQVGCILLLDMGTVRGVLMLAVATNAASMFSNVLAGAYGFWKGPRQVDEYTSIPPDVNADPESSAQIG
jgi:hypothetical protein